MAMKSYHVIFVSFLVSFLKFGFFFCFDVRYPSTLPSGMSVLTSNQCVSNKQSVQYPNFFSDSGSRLELDPSYKEYTTGSGPL